MLQIADFLPIITLAGNLIAQRNLGCTSLDLIYTLEVYVSGIAYKPSHYSFGFPSLNGERARHAWKAKTLGAFLRLGGCLLVNA